MLRTSDEIIELATDLLTKFNTIINQDKNILCQKQVDLFLNIYHSMVDSVNKNNYKQVLQNIYGCINFISAHIIGEDGNKNPSLPMAKLQGHCLNFLTSIKKIVNNEIQLLLEQQKINSEDKIISFTFDLLIQWKALLIINQKIFLKEHDLASVELAAKSISSNCQGQIDHFSIAIHIFTLMTFLNVKVNGENGIKSKHPMIADAMERMFLKYFYRMKELGFVGFDLFTHRKKTAKDILHHTVTNKPPLYGTYFKLAQTRTSATQAFTLVDSKVSPASRK